MSYFLNYTYSGIGFPLKPNGEIEWDNPEWIGGAFNRTESFRENVDLLDNGENPPKRWAVLTKKETPNAYHH